MNEEPKVSIIIPVYNAGKYLEECLNSVIDQSYSNIEIIVVDDGSNDGSSAVCDRYLTDKRVSVFHRENSGLSKSRQFGIDICQGEYFCLIDSDDYIDKDYVRELVSCVRSKKSDVGICERYDFLDGESSFKIVKQKGFYEYKEIREEDLIDDYRKYAREFGLSDSWDKIFRTDFVRSSGVKFDLDKRFNGNDLAFNYKLLLHCPKYSMIQKPLLYHRIWNGSMVRKKDKPLQEGFEIVIQQLSDEADKMGLLLDNGLSDTYIFLMNRVLADIEKNCLVNKLRSKLADFIKRHEEFKLHHQYIDMSSINNLRLKQKIYMKNVEKNSVSGLMLSILFFRYGQKFAHKVKSILAIK